MVVIHESVLFRGNFVGLWAIISFPVDGLLIRSTKYGQITTNRNSYAVIYISWVLVCRTSVWYVCGDFSKPFWWRRLLLWVCEVQVQYIRRSEVLSVAFRCGMCMGIFPKLILLRCGAKLFLVYIDRSWFKVIRTVISVSLPNFQIQMMQCRKLRHGLKDWLIDSNLGTL